MKSSPPIPRDLDEAVDLILTDATKADKADFAKQEGGFPGAQCSPGFFSGMGLRNAWGLWFGKTGISKWLRDNGIYHGDDQSSVIYHAVWCRLNGRPLDLVAEAAFYEGYWAKSGIDHSKAVP